MKKLAERDLLLIIILRGIRREKRKPRVCVRQVCWESSIPLTAAAVFLNWFNGPCIVTLTYRSYVKEACVTFIKLIQIRYTNFCYISIYIMFFNEYSLTVSLLPKYFNFLFMWTWKLVIGFVFIFTLRSEVENFQLQWLVRAYKEQCLQVDQVLSVGTQKNISYVYVRMFTSLTSARAF